MDVVQTCHASKRKQECLYNGSVHRNADTEALNPKKQRVGGNFVHGNAEIQPQLPVMLNGHSIVNGCQKANMASVEEVKAEIEGNMSEPMECAEEMNSRNVEVNGNEPSFNSKLCPHGHLNTCTTYHVPCRYPRMYCHPGGIIEDRLQVYHGF